MVGGSQWRTDATNAAILLRESKRQDDQIHHPANAANIRAQLHVPLWNEVRSYFSFGECTRSSSSAKPTMMVSMPSTRLKSPTIGIEPPSPIAIAFLPHSAASAVRVLASAGLSNGSSIPAAPAKLLNSTLASAGSRARTKA